MRARTLGYVVAALTPFWLLAILAIQGRYFISPHSDVELGNENTKRILAYSMVLRYTSLHEKQLENLESDSIDDVVARWLKHYNSDLLADIPQIAPDDDGSYGFRNEIESSRRTVIVAIHRDLKQLLENGNYEQVAHRLEQQLQLCNISKYNSSYSTLFSTKTQLDSIKIFESIHDKLAPVQRQQVVQAIQRVNSNPDLILHNSKRLALVSTATSHQENAELPSKTKMKLILTSSQPDPISESMNKSEGTMLTQSFRVAYQQELELSEVLNRYRLTALKTN